MNRFKLTFALAVVAIMVCSVSVQAAAIHLDIAYAGSVDSSFSPTSPDPIPLHAAPAPHPGAPSATFLPGDVYHQFDVYATLSDMAAGEDLQGVSFNMILGPGVSSGGLSDANFVWFGNPTTFNQSGPGNGAALFSTNADAGAQDLQAVLLIANSLNSFQGVHFRHPGEVEPSGDANPGNEALPPPYLLGSAFVKWDGTFGGDNKSFIALEPGNNVDPWATVIGATGTARGPETMTFGPRSEWVGEPVSGNDPPVADEPNDIPGVNANVPGVVNYLFTATDPNAGDVLSWDLLTLVSYTPNYGGDPLGVANGLAQAGASETDLTSGGAFSWTSTGAPRGDYVWSARVSDDGDPSLSDVTTLSVHVTAVPEPATLAMLGLAMLGFVGFTRRR